MKKFHYKTKSVMNCYVMLVNMYGSRCWTNFSQKKQKVEETEIWFYRGMMRIPWIERISNVIILVETETKT